MIDRLPAHALRLVAPDRLDLGPKLFGKPFGLSTLIDKLSRAALESTREIVRLRPNISVDELRAQLLGAHLLRPLLIGSFQTMSVDRHEREFRASRATCRGRLATGTVLYSGSPVMWLHQPSDQFDSQLNGKVGSTSVRIRDLLDPLLNLYDFEAHVVERLAACQHALADQDRIIAAMNERAEQQIDDVLARQAPALDQLRRAAR
jgi:hypothetical protein